MKPKQKFTAALILASTVLFGVLAITATPQGWQEKLQKNLYYEHPASDDIIIVYIDDWSTDDTRLGRFSDWNRQYYAQAIDNLTEADVSVIGIDLVFNHESQGISQQDVSEILTTTPSANDALDEFASYVTGTHPDDTVLAQSIEEAGNVVLAKYEGTSSIEQISKFALDEGLATGEISQSNLTLAINGEGTFSQKIAEHFSGSTYEEVPNPMYVNYVGPAGTYEYYSFHDIYLGNFGYSDFKDKIVLIGVGSPTLQDHYMVPIGTNSMYGIEIQANAIQTILDEKFIDPASGFKQIATIFMLSILATLLFMYLGTAASIISILALGTGYWIFAEASFRQGKIANLIYPFIAILAIYISVSGYKFFIENKEKKYIKSAFGHYVSPEIVDQISKNPDSLKLGGEKRTITAFFADIQNFTTWSEGTPPEELVSQLNEYFSALSEIIMRNQGTVDKFEGDAIMAFWGAPLSVENHAFLACKTALEIRTKITELNKTWAATGKKQISFRIGINTGEAIIGNIGSKDRFDYTAIGDTVNLAARLESANKFYGTQIMLSSDTHEHIGIEFELRRLDRVRVKGKETPINIFELIATKDRISNEASLLINEFHSAIEYYRNADWANALARFESLAQKIPNDGPTKTYIERIKKLQISSPPNWDGIWTFETK